MSKIYNVKSMSVGLQAAEESLAAIESDSAPGDDSGHMLVLPRANHGQRVSRLFTGRMPNRRRTGARFEDSDQTGVPPEAGNGKSVNGKGKLHLMEGRSPLQITDTRLAALTHPNKNIRETLALALNRPTGIPSLRPEALPFAARILEQLEPPADMKRGDIRDFDMSYRKRPDGDQVSLDGQCPECIECGGECCIVEGKEDEDGKDNTIFMSIYEWLENVRKRIHLSIVRNDANGVEGALHVSCDNLTAEGCTGCHGEGEERSCKPYDCTVHFPEFIDLDPVTGFIRVWVTSTGPEAKCMMTGAAKLAHLPFAIAQFKEFLATNNDLERIYTGAIEGMTGYNDVPLDGSLLMQLLPSDFHALVSAGSTHSWHRVSGDTSVTHVDERLIRSLPEGSVERAFAGDVWRKERQAAALSPHIFYHGVPATNGSLQRHLRVSAQIA